MLVLVLVASVDGFSKCFYIDNVLRTYIYIQLFLIQNLEYKL